MSNLFSRILVGIDDSEASVVAALLGARLAREHDGELLLCHSVNWIPVVAEADAADGIIDPQPLIDSLKQQGKALVAKAAEQAERIQVTPRRLVVEGEAAAALLGTADLAECSLIVMGTHGRGGLERLLLGSTTAAMLRESVIPVLTVRAESKLAKATNRCFGRIIVAADDSEPSRAALETVLALPAEDRREVIICSVVDSHRTPAQAQSIVDRAIDSARSRNSISEGRVAEGNVGEMLIAVARHQHADLLAVGSHGRHGLQRLFVGSIAENVVRKASVPVLVIRTLTTPAPAAAERHQAAAVPN